MGKQIRIGTSSLTGAIYGDYEQYKVCNFCIHFRGIGLHACCGDCLLKNKRIEGGYTGGYEKEAKMCDSFECRPELLKEN